VRIDCHKLARQASTEINLITGLPAIHNGDDTWFGQMAAVRLPDEVNNIQLKACLYERYYIEIPLIEWDGLKLIRASFQAFSSKNDLEALLAALKTEL
jgi:selenocysteine lyase/cysteine desulfurase